ncbi:leucine-rich repeat-containing protein 71-like isoform X2 [Agrilus planipennis]|uniref:Leucine-rich repeat-containing protein 71-like isoform X2 n=1 Tax=Agrilus planipennis TaxID=224129 RepID=A0A7F5R3N1_AGRPL|nr:leucine-rich repeat-containing protein 71-like isoform X2 [Agrilus planipennis]
MVKSPTSSITGARVSRGRLSKSSKSKTSYSAIWENDFDLYFQRLCNQENVSNIINFTALQDEPSLRSFGSNLSLSRKSRRSSQLQANIYNTILTIYENAETKTNLTKIIIKYLKLQPKLIEVLGKALKSFSSVTILKLEFCNLKHEQIILLKEILKENINITELSIAGNPNEFQTFHQLLKKNKLEYVSMKLCEIDDRGVEKIAKVLRVFDHPLIYLNLSSNKISSEGTKHLSQMLRINRNLKGLNLCDNWITDEGVNVIMEALKKFSLSQDELYIRRKRIFDYLLRRKDLLLKGLVSPGSTSVEITSSRSKKSASKLKDSTAKLIKGRSSSIMKKRPTSASSSRKFSTPSSSKRMNDEFEKLLGKDLHPFVKDSQPSELEIFCTGNLTLVHLNLSCT